MAIEPTVSEETARRIAEALERLAAAVGGPAPAPAPAPAPVVAVSPWMTTEEAAAYLRCSPQRIREMVATGRLARSKDGARNLYRRADVERLVRSLFAVRPKRASKPA